MKTNLNTNTIKKYAIVDKKGKILEKFRLLLTAKQTIPYYRNKYFPMELKIIEI